MPSAPCDSGSHDEEISQRDLGKDDPKIIKAVMAGESYVVTREGEPVAELTAGPEWPPPLPSALWSCVPKSGRVSSQDPGRPRELSAGVRGFVVRTAEVLDATG